MQSKVKKYESITRLYHFISSGASTVHKLSWSISVSTEEPIFACLEVQNNSTRVINQTSPRRLKLTSASEAAEAGGYRISWGQSRQVWSLNSDQSYPNWKTNGPPKLKLYTSPRPPSLIVGHCRSGFKSSVMWSVFVCVSSQDLFENHLTTQCYSMIRELTCHVYRLTDTD